MQSTREPTEDFLQEASSSMYRCDHDDAWDQCNGFKRSQHQGLAKFATLHDQCARARSECSDELEGKFFTIVHAPKPPSLIFMKPCARMCTGCETIA